MTNDQINAAIAEACGWRKEDGVYMWTQHGVDCTCPELWDWCNDLNAMHEAEKVLLDWEGYVSALAKVTGAEDSCGRDFMSAPARQRAEAFLRTLGKWSTAEDSSAVQKEVAKP